MPGNRRKTTFIPRSVQSSLLLRAILHWTFLLTATGSILLVWQFLVGEPHHTFKQCLADTWSRFGPCFVVLLMVLPVVVHDTLKFSNRVAGPLFRLRRALEALANHERVAPIRFRKGDFFQELAQHFNTALARIQRDEGPLHCEDSEQSEYADSAK